MIARLSVRAPVASAIAKWFCRYISQDVCPWNVKFAQELKVPAFAARETLAGKDARAIARELLAMTQDEFSAAFKGSPMKRAKRRGLARNASVALGNVGTADDVPALEAALNHDEPLVREHAARALRLLDDEPDASARRISDARSSNALASERPSPNRLT